MIHILDHCAKTYLPQEPSQTILISEALYFIENETQVVFTTKLMFKVHLTCKLTVKTMRNAIGLLDIGAGVNHVHT